MRLAPRHIVQGETPGGKRPGANLLQAGITTKLKPAPGKARDFTSCLPVLKLQTANLRFKPTLNLSSKPKIS